MRQNWNHKSHSGPRPQMSVSCRPQTYANISILFGGRGLPLRSPAPRSFLKLALKNDIKFVFAEPGAQSCRGANKLATEWHGSALALHLGQVTQFQLQRQLREANRKIKQGQRLFDGQTVDLPMASNKSQECQATWNNLSRANDQNKPAREKSHGRLGRESCPGRWVGRMGVAGKASTLPLTLNEFSYQFRFGSDFAEWEWEEEQSFGFNCWIFRPERGHGRK